MSGVWGTSQYLALPATSQASRHMPHMKMPNKFLLENVVGFTYRTSQTDPVSPCKKMMDKIRNEGVCSVTCVIIDDGFMIIGLRGKRSRT